MTTFTEGQHTGEFMVSEANGARAREQATLLTGQNLTAGAVLGKTTIDTTSVVAAADAGNTGDGVMTMATPAFAAGVKAGVYVLTCIEPAANAGVFEIEGPDGVVVDTATVAVAFDGEVKFTIADGAADFVAGDRFTITVASGAGKFKEYNPANSDGSQTPAGVLYAAVDATAADKACVVVVRDAEVADASLQWFTGASAGQKTTGKAGLATLGIIAR